MASEGRVVVQWNRLWLVNGPKPGSILNRLAKCFSLRTRNCQVTTTFSHYASFHSKSLGFPRSMEDGCEVKSAGTGDVLPNNSEVVAVDSELQVHTDSDVEKSSGLSGAESLSGISQGWLPTIPGWATGSFCQRCLVIARVVRSWGRGV